MASHTRHSAAVGELMAQHARLRAMIARCDQLADELERGAIDALALLREVTRLRITLAAHNQREERLLRPLLLDPASSGTAAGARMVDDHVQDHRAIQQALDTETSDELRRVLGALRAHLDAEDRLFSAAGPWSDDLGC